jgi:hypothetical protein
VSLAIFEEILPSILLARVAHEVFMELYLDLKGNLNRNGLIEAKVVQSQISELKHWRVESTVHS